MTNAGPKAVFWSITVNVDLMLSRARRRRLLSTCLHDRPLAPKGKIGSGVWKRVALLFAFAVYGLSSAYASTCYGTPGHGRVVDGVQLPFGGNNFAAYSRLGAEMGRTYVHSLVRQVVLDAYAGLEKTAPGKTYVYGETGFAHGGAISPHRSHQNGLAVDFMVPVLDDDNRSVPLPSSPMNKFGYGLEFDNQGRIPGFRIDFDAMAEHLYQVSAAAHRHGVTIERIIFDPPLMNKLFSSGARGAELRHLPFMMVRPWIRHGFVA